MLADPTSAEGLKRRRKAQGWTRVELADRAAIDPRVVQLVELDQWDDVDARNRMDAVLGLAESGLADPRLYPVQLPSNPMQGDES
jgi:transcriptional regulator with XRE-family HTH domain